MATPRIKAKAAGPALGLNLYSIVPWAAVSGLIALVSGGLAAHQGDLLEPLYPLAALAVGALLYWRYPAFYLGFTWWLWFLTPEVRRLVDYQVGWTPQNLTMLAPYLVTALASFTLMRHLPKLGLIRYLPFGLILLGLFYGYGVGAFKAGPGAATFALLDGALPVLFAFHLFVHWRSYPRHRQAIRHTFVWGVLVMGLYGILQFFDPPAWDRLWMTNASLASIGTPEPFEVRVFSTLNSPGPFALVMMAGLLLLFSGGGLPRWFAVGSGYVSFLLSLVRSAWGGWIVGVAFFAAQVRGRLRLRLLAVAVVMSLIVFPLLTIGPVADTVNERLQTTTSLQEDKSFRARVEFYSTFLPQALFNPVGEGLGNTGVSTKLSTGTGELGEFGNFDSGIMDVPFTLGWPGSLLYVGGLAWLVLRALRRGARSDLFAAASQGIVVALLFQLLFGKSLTGVVGMVFWSFLGLLLAAEVYQSRTRNANGKAALAS